MEPLKPKLLIFINTLEKGGAERVVSLLLQNLNNDFELHLALFTDIIEYSIPRQVKILSLHQPLRQNYFIRLLTTIGLSYKIFKYCKLNNITTSVAFLYRACFINALLKSIWGYRGKVIMCERIHQSGLQMEYSRLYKFATKCLIKFAYNRADLILANSYSIENDLKENFNIKTPVKVIYNPIDIDLIETKIQENIPLQLDSDTFYFVNVAGFRKQKNHLLLLKSFAMLKNLNCKLILAGSGTLEKATKDFAEKEGIADKVLFLGPTENPFSIINQCDCFVLSSNSEGFPNVLLEALACGKPVISTDCNSGPRELLAPSTNFHYQAVNNFEIGEYGILTPVNDVEILATAMLKMCKDVELRMRFEAKAKGRAQQFDVEVIKQYFHLAFTTV